MKDLSLQRIDAYPYRHGVGEIMSPLGPSLKGPEMPDEIARFLTEEGYSAALVEQGGIVTERDLVRCLAAGGCRSAREIMSPELITVGVEDRLAVAMGRMTRHGLRHLVVVDALGVPVGMLTARDLMRQRATTALVLADEIHEATCAEELAEARGKLPALARSLLAEKVAAFEIAGVLAEAYCALTTRAVALAMAERTEPAPVSWCYLVLGSSGRGESLLAADQDNALIHGGGPENDDWFKALGARVSHLLDQAGLPLCKGGVMASNARWRQSVEGWDRQVERWTFGAGDSEDGEDLLAVDIFYDFIGVCGDGRLAQQLRQLATEKARRPLLSRTMAREIDSLGTPFGFLGGLRSEEGRIDLKKFGLFPIIAGARAMALCQGLTETATEQRLDHMVTAGLLVPEDREAWRVARHLFMELILRQQLRDLEVGREPGNAVELSALSFAERRQLKTALKAVQTVGPAVQDVMMKTAAG